MKMWAVGTHTQNRYRAGAWQQQPSPLGLSRGGVLQARGSEKRSVPGKVAGKIN